MKRRDFLKGAAAVSAGAISVESIAGGLTGASASSPAPKAYTLRKVYLSGVTVEEFDLTAIELYNRVDDKHKVEIAAMCRNEFALDDLGNPVSLNPISPESPITIQEYFGQMDSK